MTPGTMNGSGLQCRHCENCEAKPKQDEAIQLDTVDKEGLGPRFRGDERRL
jgi:hypothetical protein